MTNIELSENPYYEPDSLSRVLKNDVVLAYRDLALYDGPDANYLQHLRRSYVRTVFACVEGSIWLIKQCLVEDVRRGRSKASFSYAELDYLRDIEFHIKENGDVREKKAKISLQVNLLFAFKAWMRSTGFTIEPDPTSTEGRAVMRAGFLPAVEIRDRITHPKLHKELEISSDEITFVESAYEWFMKVMAFPFAWLRGSIAESEGSAHFSNVGGRALEMTQSYWPTLMRKVGWQETEFAEPSDELSHAFAQLKPIHLNDRILTVEAPAEVIPYFSPELIDHLLYLLNDMVPGPFHGGPPYQKIQMVVQESSTQS